MTYGSMEASTSFSCQEVDGSVADIRWRLKRLLEDYAAVLSRLSLAHLSQNADGMRLLESQLFDTARRDLAESDDTFFWLASKSLVHHPVRHVGFARGLLKRAVEKIDGAAREQVEPLSLLRLASDELKAASVLASHPLFDTSTCCANHFHPTLEPKNERSFNLGA